MNKAINLEQSPQEKWLQYKLSLNHSLKKFKNSQKILITLTSQYPEKGKYWKQLYQTYLSTFNDKKALAVMEMAYKEGHIQEEKEILNMASLMIYLKMPFKASVITEKEMKISAYFQLKRILNFYLKLGTRQERWITLYLL